jgi:hypothetical protein
MKYMIMMFGGLGAAMQDRTPEWITGMQELMMKLDTELKEAGEVVAGHGLVDPSQAKTVRRLRFRVRPRVGEHGVAGTTLAWMWRADLRRPRPARRHAHRVAASGAPARFERTFEQDPALGIR